MNRARFFLVTTRPGWRRVCASAGIVINCFCVIATEAVVDAIADEKLCTEDERLPTNGHFEGQATCLVPLQIESVEVQLRRVAAAIRITPARAHPDTNRFERKAFVFEFPAEAQTRFEPGLVVTGKKRVRFIEPEVRQAHDRFEQIGLGRRIQDDSPRPRQPVYSKQRCQDEASNDSAKIFCGLTLHCISSLLRDRKSL